MEMQKKRKIVFIGRFNDSEILSGPEKAAKRIFSVISQKEDASFVEYFFDGNKFSLLEKLFGYNKIKAGVLRLGIFRTFFYILSEKPAVINIITFERFAMAAVFASPFIRAKIVFNVHGVVKYEHSLRSIPYFTRLKDFFVEKILFKYSNKLLFFSKASVKVAEKYYMINPEKIVFTANGVDDVFHSQEHLKAGSEINIVFVGEINRPEKGFDFFADVLNILKVPVNVFIISNINDYNIAANDKIKITFINKMASPEFADFLIDKDIVVSTSTHETFSISTLECMAAGLIPIVTPNIGVSEFIKDGNNGYIVELDDPNAFAQVIELLSSDKEKRISVSQNAREIFHQLNWQKIGENYMKIYSDLTAGR